LLDNIMYSRYGNLTILKGEGHAAIQKGGGLPVEFGGGNSKYSI
jgi:hypothetical protein